MDRKKTTAEDFTPPWLINQMIDKLFHYGQSKVTGEDKTYLDPACGNGNILVEVYKRKLHLGHDPVKALGTLYGCDIMHDNIRECRLRLLSILRDSGIAITVDHIVTVLNHIVVTPLKSYPLGALDYDFSFPDTASVKRIEELMDGIVNKGWLDSPDTSNSDMDDDDWDEAQQIYVIAVFNWC